MSNVVGLRPGVPEPKVDDEEGLSAAEEEAYNDLIGMTVEEILREGQKALFGRLVAAARAGTASHQQMAILRNLLKDNGLTLGIPPEKEAPVKDPLPLPVYGDDE